MNLTYEDYEVAVLSRLAGMTVESGGVLKTLKGYVGYSSEYLEEMMADLFGGRFPGVLVEITGASYGELKGGVQRQSVTITLYTGTSSFRNQSIARQDGVSAILHGIRTLLMGHQLITGTMELSLLREYKLGSSPQYVLYGAEYLLINPKIKVGG
jgi:hypothetical protein